MHQLTIDLECHTLHYLFDGSDGPVGLESLGKQFEGDYGFGCPIHDYGEEKLTQPGLLAFYVEQAA